MRVLFHPGFAKEIRQYESEYAIVSQGLATRFRHEIQIAIEAIKSSPGGAGHILNLGSSLVRNLRRRNLRTFPFFVLYGFDEQNLFFGSVIPSRSDPLKWLARFPQPPKV
jgi:hypothetical protein